MVAQTRRVDLARDRTRRFATGGTLQSIRRRLRWSGEVDYSATRPCISARSPVCALCRLRPTSRSKNSFAGVCLPDWKARRGRRVDGKYFAHDRPEDTALDQLGEFGKLLPTAFNTKERFFYFRVFGRFGTGRDSNKSPPCLIPPK